MVGRGRVPQAGLEHSSLLRAPPVPVAPLSPPLLASAPAAYRAPTSAPDVHVERSSARWTHEASDAQRRRGSSAGSRLPVCSQQASSGLLLTRPLLMAPLTSLCLQQPDSGPKVCAETGPRGLRYRSCRRCQAPPAVLSRVERPGHPRGSAGVTGLALHR